jgi:hypothetical protein
MFASPSIEKAILGCTWIGNPKLLARRNSGCGVASNYSVRMKKFFLLAGMAGLGWGCAAAGTECHADRPKIDAGDHRELESGA